MGVYIPKMTMPRRCGECPFGKCDSCHMNLMIYGHDRTDCPLVEVKPHGRLIDADAIEYTDCEHGVLYDVVNAPTIIEAEREDDTVDFC